MTAEPARETPVWVMRSGLREAMYEMADERDGNKTGRSVRGVVRGSMSAN